MKQFVFTAVALVALGGLATAQSKKVTPLKPGAKAPDFELTTWDGKRSYKLSDFRTKGDKVGKLVVVDFWCSKCPGSRRYDPALSQIARDYTQKGVQFIAIDANGLATTTQLKRYIDSNKLTFPIVMDQNFKISDAFGALVTPHVFVVDQQGVIQYAGGIDNRRRKSDPRHTPHLTNALDALLGGKTIPTKVSRAFG